MDCSCKNYTNNYGMESERLIMKIISDVTLDTRFTKGKEYEVVSLQEMLDTVAYMVIGDNGKKEPLFQDEFHIPLKEQSHVRWRKVFKARGYKKKVRKLDGATCIQYEKDGVNYIHEVKRSDYNIKLNNKFMAFIASPVFGEVL